LLYHNLDSIKTLDREKESVHPKLAGWGELNWR